MSRNVDQLKKEARRAEQASEWDRAIQLYRRAIRASDEAGEVAPDVSLYNRVGDLYRRRGDTDRAVHYYLEAVDRYAEQDLHTGAIALCNKILRITPDRVEVYRKLGRLHAATGLVAEARNSYLEYASRMEDEGHPEARQEAFLELARITEDETLYLRTVDELESEGRTEQAVEALLELWESRRERGEASDELRHRIVSLDPSADPASDGGPPDETPEATPDERAPDAATAVPEASTDPEPPADSTAEPAASRDVESGASPAPPSGSRPDVAAGGPSAPDGDETGDDVAGAPEGQPPAADGGTADAGRAAPEQGGSDRTEVRLRYAEVLCRSGRNAEAVEQLEKLLSEIDPAETPARGVRALELLDEVGGLDEGWRERALAWAGRISDPQAAEEFRELAGEPDATETSADEELSASAAAPPEEPATPETDIGETDARSSKEEPPTAEARPAEAGEAQPEAEEDAGRLDELMVGFRARAEETVGQADPREHLELGQALHDMDRLDDAIREFQVAARAPEPPIRAFELLGAAFLEKGLPSVAVRVLTRALRIPGHQDYDLLQVLYLLGLAREELGESEAARDCYERVYSIDIDFGDVADRMRSLAR